MTITLVGKRNKKFIQLRAVLGLAFAIVAMSPVNFSFAQQDTLEPVMLSLESAVLFSLDTNMGIKSVAEQSMQAGYAVEEAQSLYYPQIQMMSEIGKEYNDPGVYKDPSQGDGSNITSAGQIKLSLRQMIYDGAAILEVKRRQKLVESADITTEIERQRIISKTIQVYLDVYRYQNDLLNLSEAVETLSKHEKRLKLAADEGGESKAKYKYVQARLEQAQGRLASASANLNKAKHELQLYTGVLPDFSAQRPLELNLSEYDVEFLKSMAEFQNPEILKAESDIQAGQIDFNKQKKEYLPKVNFLMEGYSDHNLGETREREGRAMVQMSYDLFKGFSKDAAKNRVGSRLKELEYDKVDTVRRIESEIMSLYSEVLADHQKASIKQKEAMSYMTLREMNKEALDQGDLDIFEVIENEDRLSNARSELNLLDVNLFLKSFDLLKNIGALKKQRFCESC